MSANIASKFSTYGTAIIPTFGAASCTSDIITFFPSIWSTKSAADAATELASYFAASFAPDFAAVDTTFKAANPTANRTAIATAIVAAFISTLTTANNAADVRSNKAADI
jgi:hypothetical protein